MVLLIEEISLLVLNNLQKCLKASRERDALPTDGARACKPISLEMKQLGLVIKKEKKGKLWLYETQGKTFWKPILYQRMIFQYLVTNMWNIYFVSKPQDLLRSPYSSSCWGLSSLVYYMRKLEAQQKLQEWQLVKTVVRHKVIIRLKKEKNFPLNTFNS